MLRQFWLYHRWVCSQNMSAFGSPSIFCRIILIKLIGLFFPRFDRWCLDKCDKSAISNYSSFSNIFLYHKIFTQLDNTYNTPSFPPLFYIPNNNYPKILTICWDVVHRPGESLTCSDTKAMTGVPSWADPRSACPQYYGKGLEMWGKPETTAVTVACV